MSTNYWLMKTEPDEFSIDDLEKSVKQTTSWFGVRNYQARNFMRDNMKLKDLALFYHSSCKLVGVAGIAEIVKEAYPDPYAFDPKSDYFDPKSKPSAPTWLTVDVKLVKKFNRVITLQEIRDNKKLVNMRLLQKGNRLSVFPIEKYEFDLICKMHE